MRLRIVCACIPLGCAILAAGCSRDEQSTTGQDPAAQSAPATPAPTPAAPAGDATAPADATASTAASGATGADGAQVFQQYCQTCHGPKGAGDGPAAAGLTPKPASFATGDFMFDPNGNGTKGEVEDIAAVVRDGAAKYGGSPLMAPWPMLSPEQIQAVANHVKSLGGA